MQISSRQYFWCIQINCDSWIKIERF